MERGGKGRRNPLPPIIRSDCQSVKHWRWIDVNKGDDGDDDARGKKNVGAEKNDLYRA